MLPRIRGVIKHHGSKRRQRFRVQRLHCVHEGEVLDRVKRNNFTAGRLNLPTRALVFLDGGAALKRDRIRHRDLHFGLQLFRPGFRTDRG